MKVSCFETAHYVAPKPPLAHRANIMLADTDEEAEEALKQHGRAVFPMRPGVRDALLKADSRNVASEARTPNVGACCRRGSSAARIRS